MRTRRSVRRMLAIVAALSLSCASGSGAPIPDMIPSASPDEPQGDLRVEIRTPIDGVALSSWESSLEIEGGASVFGGVRYLELMLVVDTSRSLQSTDPENFRSAGAIGLVQELPGWSDVQIGIVDFDSRARLVQPLTTDRGSVVDALDSLDRDGRTNLAAGIRTALAELERASRPDATRVILLFTDGKSDEDAARRAASEAAEVGVAVHTIHLGESAKGVEILTEIARESGGSFVHVSDPSKLPEAFLGLRTTGIESVTLRVNDSDEIPARLVGGSFSERVPLELGENWIIATATSLSGEVREARVHVTVSGPLAVSIEEPLDGSTVGHGRQQVRVAGTVDAFVGLSTGSAAGAGEEPALDRESSSEAGADGEIDLSSREAKLGVSEVVLQSDAGTPVVASVVDGRFEVDVPVLPGTRQIRAVASTFDGRRAETTVTVEVQAPGCAELQVAARRDGRSALSVSERSIEVVLDGSNSMWGRMDGEPKMQIAQEILDDTVSWLDRDVRLGLRAYGHRKSREQRDCRDTELLVGFADDNREQIRSAIASLKPRGVTPIAHSLDQVSGDFANVRGERAVVLVTDGIESCGGDPVAAARRLGSEGTPVHVIGFGLGNAADEDTASLRAIAEASGGQFILATSAEELRKALAVTVGTPFQVLRGSEVVAEGALGSGERVRIPAGDYVVRLRSDPPQEAAVTLVSDEGLTLSWERAGEAIVRSLQRRAVEYEPCWEGTTASAPEQPAPRTEPAPQSTQPPADADDWSDEVTR